MGSVLTSNEHVYCVNAISFGCMGLIRFGFIFHVF